MLYNGQPSAYAKRLREEYGQDIVEILEAKRTEIIREMDYEKIAGEYKAKYEALVLEQDML
jgi:hypothetical protein